MISRPMRILAGAFRIHKVALVVPIPEYPMSDDNPGIVSTDAVVGGEGYERSTSAQFCFDAGQQARIH